jgi:hypothetical protein
MATVISAAEASAQTTPRAATIARPAPAADLGSLAAPIREEPSPAITSLKGVGTANAVAEGRVTQQVLKEFCSANAQYYKSAADCVGQFANRVYRATADCTAGRITTTSEVTYTLDGIWAKDSDGAGRTRWKDSTGAVAAPDLIDNGLHVSQQWETLCPGAVTPALIARAKGVPAAPPQAARGAAAPARAAAAPVTPSICGSQRLCDEVNTFAATITDFRPSQSGDWKSVAATVRFQNKSNRPLILGYVRTSSVAVNEAGNRYTITDPKYVRGVGEIAGTEFDPKFSLAPGQAADARFEFWWRWNGSEIIGVRAWDVALTIREVNEVAPGQYRFGQEHSLQFRGAVPANMPGAAPAGSPVSAAPAPAAPQISANLPDQCAGRLRCYDTGPFVAEIVTVTPSIVRATYPWHVMTMNIRFRNKTNEPLTLAYVAASGALSDNFGNRYAPSSPPQDVKGMGVSDAAKADPQFVLQPGESRAATFIQSRQVREQNKPMGETFTFVLSIAQLQVLYNGQQIRTLREHSLTFADWPPSGTATPPANSGPPPAGVPGAPPIVSEGDACAARPRCYDAGNFVAEVVQTTPSIVKATYPWHVATMSVRFRNKTNQPLVLAYAARSGSLTDNFSNQYVPGNPQDVQGMGVIGGGKADPQFVLRPGESRAATFVQSRQVREQNKPMGQEYTFVMTIAELEVLYNGQQIRTQRENSLTFTGITMGGAPGTTAAPQSGAEAVENIKKAGEAIRGLFGNREKK